MKSPRIKRAHGGVRGSDVQRRSLQFEGPFGRIFRTVPPADFGETEADNITNFTNLAAGMNGDPNAKDGPDNEESGIPAAYTYLGQFIDHDLTFDPASSLQKQNDPDALEDFRTPKFDLDNLYGRGPDDQPYLYCTVDGVKSALFVRGGALTGAATNPNATDLPRASNQRAIIGDPRNDENKIVSQLQGIFHRFHNRIATDNPTWDFPRVQQEVRFHYQWVVLHDFLPTVVCKHVIQDVLRHDGPLLSVQTKFFKARDFAYMPLEFSAACYRFGHSMVRPGYRMNDGDGTLLPIFAPGPSQTTDGKATDLRGFETPPAEFAMDWQRFANITPLPYGTLVDNPDPTLEANRHRLQLAYKIDTSLVMGLANLPPAVAVNPNILALRNLIRGWRMRLPNGQDIARAMGVTPLTDDEIQIGKFTGDPADLNGSITKFGEAFAGNCPLWIYTLAETRHHVEQITVQTTEGDKVISTPKLGNVGGRIVAETIAGLIQMDSTSYLGLDPLWAPSRDVGVGKPRSVSYADADGGFRLKDLIIAALDDGNVPAC